MLHVPDYYNNYNILSIDPGLNNTGISIYNCSGHVNNVNTISAFSLNTDKVDDPKYVDEFWHTERMLKICRMKQALQNILIQVNPCLVICESPFFNRLMPSAYQALVQVISGFQQATIEYNQNIPFYFIEPLLVKKKIGAGFTSGKVSVKEMVGSNDFIMSRLVSNINYLDEHAIDAIAIAYGYIKSKEF